MAPILYPNIAEHHAARVRLLKRLRPLLNSPDQHKRSVGFFLFGLTEALRGKRHA